MWQSVVPQVKTPLRDGFCHCDILHERPASRLSGDSKDGGSTVSKANISALVEV